MASFSLFLEPGVDLVPLSSKLFIFLV